MVKVYAVTLVVGLIGLLVIILGGAWSENVGRGDRDPGRRFGATGRMIVGGLLGFGMAGMSAEFAPLGFVWGVSLLLALVGGLGGVVWTRYASASSAAG